MSYNNLTNEEIVFLYFVSLTVARQYETTFKENSIKQTLPTKEGSVNFTIDLPIDFINEIMKSKHYTLMKDINRKLKPLYELITEAEPDIVNIIKELFKKK